MQPGMMTGSATGNPFIITHYDKPEPGIESETSVSVIKKGLTTDQEYKSIYSRICSPLAQTRLDVLCFLQCTLRRIQSPEFKGDCTLSEFQAGFFQQVNRLAECYPSLIKVHPDPEGILTPILTAAALEKILRLSPLADQKGQARLQSTRFIPLHDSHNSNAKSLLPVLDKLLKDADACFTGNRPGQWECIIFHKNNHFTPCLLNWNGHSIMAILVDSTGLYLFTPRAGELQLGAVHTSRLLFEALRAAMPEAFRRYMIECTTQVKTQLETGHVFSESEIERMKKVQKQDLSKESGEIVYFEPMRQMDHFTCSVFTQHDLANLLPRSAIRGLKGKRATAHQPAGSEAFASEAQETLSSFVAGVNLSTLTQYPAEMLMPTQSLTLLEELLGNLGAEAKKTVMAKLQPYLKTFKTNAGNEKTVNLFAMTRYIENLIKLLEAEPLREEKQ